MRLALHLKTPSRLIIDYDHACRAYFEIFDIGKIGLDWNTASKTSADDRSFKNYD